MRASLLLVSCATVLSLAPAARALDCPEEQRVRLDLDRWAAQLKGAAPGSPQQKQAVAAAGFAPIPDGSNEIPDAACVRTPRLAALELLRSRLTSEGDRTVHARFEMCEGNPAQRFTSVRIAVFVPLQGGALCRLHGEDLSKDQAAWDSPCADKGARGGEPRTIALRKLTNPALNVLEVRDQGGDCRGGAREGLRRLAVYEAHGAALDRIFENKLWELSAASNDETVWTLRYGRTLPKTIEVRRQSRCLEDPRKVCTAGADTKRYVYQPPPVAAYVRDGDLQ